MQVERFEGGTKVSHLVTQPPPQAETENIAPEAPSISAPASNISPAPRESGAVQT